ncbi:hypothetical protein OESDEN_15789, partial [Oesophagostomum dentatum]
WLSCSFVVFFLQRNTFILTILIRFGYQIGSLSAMHYAYYKIQNNPSLVAPEQRAELFYVRWLKEKFPALRPYGVQEYKPEPPAAKE